ncbi:MAG: S41 family peptidase [Spirulinaceae cyanobacterium]
MNNKLSLTMLGILVASTCVLLTNQKLFSYEGMNSEKFQEISPDLSQELITEAWKIIEKDYIDPTFNGQDWNAVLQRTLEKERNSDESPYQLIQEMLSSLGDSSTRLIPMPSEQIEVLKTQPDLAIGLQFRLDEQTKSYIVYEVYDNSPAYKAGILPGDILVDIDRKALTGLSLSEVVYLLHGEEGTPMTIKGQRGQQELRFEVTREPFEVPNVSYTKQDSNIGSIGYIRLMRFHANASREMREAIEELESQNVKGYILDLRNNQGGLFFASIVIANMWIERGTIVTTVGRQGMTEEKKANPRVKTRKPVVILVNGLSSRASEILAGALQDNQRGFLVGTETYGDNSIQSVRDLKSGLRLLVTTAKWYTPKGKNVNSSGLTPDKYIALTQEQKQSLFAGKGLIATSNDPQYTEALSMLATLTTEVAD